MQARLGMMWIPRPSRSSPCCGRWAAPPRCRWHRCRHNCRSPWTSLAAAAAATCSQKQRHRQHAARNVAAARRHLRRSSGRGTGPPRRGSGSAARWASSTAALRLAGCPAGPAWHAGSAVWRLQLAGAPSRSVLSCFSHSDCMAATDATRQFVLTGVQARNEALLHKHAATAAELERTHSERQVREQALAGRAHSSAAALGRQVLAGPVPCGGPAARVRRARWLGRSAGCPKESAEQPLASPPRAVARRSWRRASLCCRRCSA